MMMVLASVALGIVSGIAGIILRVMLRLTYMQGALVSGGVGIAVGLGYYLRVYGFEGFNAVTATPIMAAIGGVGYVLLNLAGDWSSET